MPWPSERPISGSRLAPKSRSAIRSRSTMWVGLVRPTMSSSLGLALDGDRGSEWKQVREPRDDRVGYADAAVADAVAEQAGLVCAVEADLSVASGEGGEDVRVGGEAERVGAVEAARV